MELIQLKAVKEKLSARTVGKYLAGTMTIIFNMDGTVKAVFPVGQKQPRKGQKTIVINCFTYALIWE